jgi:hypothetical protein
MTFPFLKDRGLRVRQDTHLEARLLCTRHNLTLLSQDIHVLVNRKA